MNVKNIEKMNDKKEFTIFSLLEKRNENINMDCSPHKEQSENKSINVDCSPHKEQSEDSISTVMLKEKRSSFDTIRDPGFYKDMLFSNSQDVLPISYSGLIASSALINKDIDSLTSSIMDTQLEITNLNSKIETFSNRLETLVRKSQSNTELNLKNLRNVLDEKNHQINSKYELLEKKVSSLESKYNNNTSYMSQMKFLGKVALGTYILYKIGLLNPILEIPKTGESQKINEISTWGFTNIKKN